MKDYNAKGKSLSYEYLTDDNIKFMELEAQVRRVHICNRNNPNLYRRPYTPPKKDQ